MPCLSNAVSVHFCSSDVRLLIRYFLEKWYFENIIHHTLAKIKDDGSIEFTWYRYRSVIDVSTFVLR